MKILLIGLANDFRLARHAKLLLDAGWRVHLADLSEHEGSSRLDPRLTVHSVTGPRSAADFDMTPGFSVPASRHEALRRVRLAVARASYKAVHEARRRRGAEVDLSRLALIPPPVRDPNDQWHSLLRTCDLRPESDVPWLGKLMARLQPDVMNSFGFVPSGVLTFATRCHSVEALPPWLLTLEETDLDVVERDPALSGAFRAALSEVAGLLVERKQELEFAESHGFLGDVVEIVPIWGGWDLAASRALWQDGPVSRRRTVVVSGARGVGGRPFVALRGMELVAEALQDHEIVVLTPGEGVDIAARLLESRSGLRVVIEPSDEVGEQLQIYGRARCAIVLNATARTDPAVQMALLMGSMPIASATCSGDGWIRSFLTGLLVDPEHPRAVAAAVRNAMTDDALVDSAADVNQTLFEQRLRGETVGERIVKLYQRAAVRLPRG